MARRLRLRISRLLQSCRSKDPTSLPSDPVPVPSLLPRPPPSLGDPSRCFLNACHVPSSLVSYCRSCGCGDRSSRINLRRTGSQKFQWKQEAGFHVIVAAATTATAPRRKTYSSSASDGGRNTHAPPPLERRKRRPRNRKRKPASYRPRISTSSGHSGLFSSEETDNGREGFHDEESAEMLLISSSRSYSTDSSSDGIRKETEASETNKAMKKKKRSRRNKGKARGSYNPEPQVAISSPARLSAVFRKLAPPCVVLEGQPAAKVRESFAVVKRSDCPYEDFKGSMMEMIVEKEMFEEEDLEQLLLCFLSLNSSRHHGAIVAAFSEIWEALFGCRRSSTASAFIRDIQ
ncbi:transcription repressor OFP7 [Punica granatum]|uniref:Transcription repressor n=1 Tax=Punica granatum TaxID=22663 RepID=A0A6P8DRH5_PUNGR|nr:transcription repressor OFP7 [Punica granatum]